ncbi:acyltransferase family protein [Marinobacter sp.]|uniref:acyltransferase family protein n=1 Tax=Marinobacter sp. TaxID=50741 RepID=UPI003A94003E
MKYRSEIDGLRALAVVPVILFHAGYESFRGGFVGVDVFFVISGYLITSIILEDLRRERFSTLNFYERRARRILPALCFVVAASLAVAWVILPYHQLIDFSESIISVFTFSSNFLFWMEAGYFDTASELKPLLHTWSLSVEEQYYIAVPLLMSLVWRYRERGLVVLLSALAIISFCLAQYSSTRYADAGFFLLHTRAWELLVGGLVAIKTNNYTNEDGNEIFSLVGVLAILLAIFFFDAHVPFPSLYTLLPIIGALLIIIYARQGTAVQRILSFAPIVYVGLISYSAYLWHQPIFAYARAISISEPSKWMMGFLSVLSMLLAYVTWKLIENPFRDSRKFSRNKIFGLSILGIIIFICLGLWLKFSDAPKHRKTLSGENFLELSRKTATNYGLNKKCVQFLVDPLCQEGEKPLALLWGDSYAMHLALALKNSPSELPFVQMTMSNCAPILGAAAYGGRYTPAWGAGCIENNQKVFDWLKTQPEIKYVILASPFRQLSDNASLTLTGGKLIKENKGLGSKLFLETIKKITSMGKDVVIVSPTPTPGYDMGKCYIRSHVLRQHSSSCDFPLSRNNRIETYKILEALSRQAQARIIWLSEIICPNGMCRVSVGETLIYRDSGHLSREGAAYLGSEYDISKMVKD